MKIHAKAVFFITVLLTCGFAIQGGDPSTQLVGQPASLQVPFGWLTNKYLVAVFLPLTILGVAAVCKKIVRKTGGWDRKDFYLGVDAALAALSSGFLHISDLAKRQNPGTNALVATMTFLIIAFSLFLILLSSTLSIQDL